MRDSLNVLLAVCFLSASVTTLPAQEAARDKAKYVKRYEDPVLKEMKAKRKTAKEAFDKATRDIRDRQEKEDEEKKAARETLRFEFGDVEKPASPEDFKRAFYFPPVAQYDTGTCWCFAGTSFMESEVARLKGKQIKLSEMYTVYHEYEGQTYTPKTFVRDGLGIDLDDYVVAMSTLAVPFYTKGEFDVPDNWWRCADYHNLPLDEWYGVIKRAAKEGYTVALGGDTSEPGYDGFQDAAIVPDFDVPQTHINQSARELRFVNRSTTDDHAIHLVGHTVVGDRDWFLIKDSARGCRHGKCKGYYFYRDDYVRLKMLAFLVHKDALKDVMEKFEP